MWPPIRVACIRKIQKAKERRCSFVALHGHLNRLRSARAPCERDGYGVSLKSSPVQSSLLQHSHVFFVSVTAYLCIFAASFLAESAKAATISCEHILCMLPLVFSLLLSLQIQIYIIGRTPPPCVGISKNQTAAAFLWSYLVPASAPAPSPLASTWVMMTQFQFL